MTITKEKKIASIEVVDNFKCVQVRTETIVKEDDNVISTSNHRHTLWSGSLDEDRNYIETNISGEDNDVQSVCNVVWTQSVKDAHRDYLIAQLPPIE